MKHDDDFYENAASLLVAGSQWKSRHGKVFTVVAISNATLPKRYAKLCPISVVYMDQEGQVFSIRADVFMQNYDYVRVDEVFGSFVDQVFAYNAGDLSADDLAANRYAEDFLSDEDEVDVSEEPVAEEVQAEVEKPVEEPKAVEEPKVEKPRLTLAEQLVKPSAQLFKEDGTLIPCDQYLFGYEYSASDLNARSVKLIFAPWAPINCSDFEHGKLKVCDELNSISCEVQFGNVYYTGYDYVNGEVRYVVIVQVPVLVTAGAPIEQPELPEANESNTDNDELLNLPTGEMGDANAVDSVEETVEEATPESEVVVDPVAETVTLEPAGQSEFVINPDASKVAPSTEATPESTDEDDAKLQEILNDTTEVQVTDYNQHQPQGFINGEPVADVEFASDTEVSDEAEVNIEDVEVKQFNDTHVDMPTNPQQNTVLADALSQAQQMTIAHRVVK